MDNIIVAYKQLLENYNSPMEHFKSLGFKPSRIGSTPIYGAEEVNVLKNKLTSKGYVEHINHGQNESTFIHPEVPTHKITIYDNRTAFLHT